MRANGPAIEQARVDDGDRLAAAVRRAQQGDVDAFEVVYRAHARGVYDLCRRMCGNDADARELVQDAFVRAWEKLAAFRGDSAFATWLHRVTVNVVLQHIRMRKREFFLDDESSEAPGVRSPAPAIEAGIDVDRALAQLPAGARTVFVLHDIQGYSHDEIAEMTGIATGTARAQLWRARQTLMKLLES